MSNQRNTKISTQPTNVFVQTRKKINVLQGNTPLENEENVNTKSIIFKYI